MRPIHAVIFAIVAGLTACSTTPTELSPGVTQEGRRLIRYSGSEASAELNYRQTKYQVGDRFLVLKLSLASKGGTVVVNRDAVRVRTPEGTTVALMEQAEFYKVYGELRANLTRSNFWGLPTDQLASFRSPCDRWLLTPLGVVGNFAYQSPLILNANRWCSGPLVFHVPKGVQSGGWLLLMGLGGDEVEIPFELGD